MSELAASRRIDDVVVVGGGPAGAAAATLLARSGARVRIFERTRFPRHKLCGDTLNPGALRLLATLGVGDAVQARSLAIDGMLLSGPGVEVLGRYGGGAVARVLSRLDLDSILLEHAEAAGVQVDDDVVVMRPRVEANRGRVEGVDVRTRSGTHAHRARLVIAADGRSSTVAGSLGLSRTPAHPRRWAIGGYFSDVDGMSAAGEMHVRRGYYIGVAPLLSGVVNACLVTPLDDDRRRWRDPAVVLLDALRADPRLADRFARARLTAPPRVLGPLAVDATAAGAPGLLLAGDAAGFIDPITGDGLRFALAGAGLAARVASAVLEGRLTPEAAPVELAGARASAFGPKWRFNRVIRMVVGPGPGVPLAAVAARMMPAAFRTAIRYAGDC
ncbi:MAG: NAD(P)/FAD-dependent oxidoreductase [Acidobacteriota bacterium]